MARSLSIRSLLWAIFVSQHLGVAASIFAVARRWPLSRGPGDHWVGIYFNRNSLAPVAMLGLLAGVFVIVDHRRVGARAHGTVGYLAFTAAMAVAFVSDAVMLLESGSLTALLGALTAGLFVLAVIPARRLRFRSVAVAASSTGLLLAAAGAWQIALQFRSKLATTFHRSETMEGRTTIWVLTRRFIGYRWFQGWGIGGMWKRADLHEMLKANNYDVNEAHNGYYEMMAAGGIFAAVLLAVVVVVGAFVVVRYATERRGALSRWPIAAFGYVLAVNLTESFFGPNLVPWALLVAVIVQAADVAPEPRLEAVNLAGDGD